jgi:hypothetical protein
MNSPAPAKTLAARGSRRKMDPARIAAQRHLEALHQLLIPAEAIAVAAMKASNLPAAPSDDHDRGVRRLIVYIDLLYVQIARAMAEAERAIDS